MSRYENFQAGCKASGSDPCLGWRPISRDGKDGRTAGDYEWLTYDEVWQRAKNFGSGLEALRLTPPSPEGEAGPEISPSLQFLGTFSRNLPEWVIAEQACNAYGRVLVPLYDTLGHDSVAYVINQTQMKTVVCSPKEVSLLLGLEEECPSLDHIVVMSTADPAEDAEFEEKDSQPWVGGSNGGHSRRSSSRGGRRVRVMHFKHVEDAGAAAPVEPTPPKPDDIATFCYTSGTTGNPKGAMLTHGNITSDMCAVFDQSVYPLKDDVHISYLPLAHMFERIMQAAMFHSGARIGFYQGDTLKLMEDIATLRPTIFPSVPRLYNKIYDKVMTGVAASPVKNLLFTLALNVRCASTSSAHTAIATRLLTPPPGITTGKVAWPREGLPAPRRVGQAPWQGGQEGRPGPLPVDDHRLRSAQPARHELAAPVLLGARCGRLRTDGKRGGCHGYHGQRLHHRPRRRPAQLQRHQAGRRPRHGIPGNGHGARQGRRCDPLQGPW